MYRLVRGEWNTKRRRTSDDLAMVEIRAGSRSQDYAHGSVSCWRPIYITCLTRREAKAGPRDCEGVLIFVKAFSLGEGDGSQKDREEAEEAHLDIWIRVYAYV